MDRKFWVEIIVGIVLIITMMIFLIVVFSNSTRCMANPLIYGAKVLTDKNNASFTCNCQFSNQPNINIFVDEKHWEYSKQNDFKLNLNWSR